MNKDQLDETRQMSVSPDIQVKKNGQMFQGRFISTMLLAVTVFASALAMPAQDQSASQDMKDAGHDAKQAAKDTGKATKKTAKNTGHTVKKDTKKATNKAAKKTKEGAQKVEDKTQPPTN